MYSQALKVPEDRILKPGSYPGRGTKTRLISVHVIPPSRTARQTGVPSNSILLLGWGAWGTRLFKFQTETLQKNGPPGSHAGRLIFFKNAAYRGSLCKLFSRGSTLVSIKPLSRWA